MELHALHQLLRQRKYLVLGSENMVYSNATHNLLEVQELHFQCQCASLEVILLDAPDKLQHRMVQVNGDG